MRSAVTATLALVLALALPRAGVAAAGVKYRGIFINDEGWGLRPWAVRHFGSKEQIGTNAYTKILELMKADGLNLLWPAMHPGGYEFSERPENFELTDSYGVTVGTSHCEPMLRNNIYLPKHDRRKWSWTRHRGFVTDYWREGVRRGSGHKVLWTIGMRGISDDGMRDGKGVRQKIGVLEDIFAAQCALLPKGAPKLFVPYKEVLPIYNAGLKVPDDTVIMWVNDNFGYVRRLGGPQAEGHGGGIYWHLSYWGMPHGYIHLCTTPPAFMWYELVAKCWNNGVRDVWMVNAGDVFQAEVLLNAYGRFAADPDRWGPDAQERVLTDFVRSRFGCEGAQASRIVRHLDEFYNLGFNRRPEHMSIRWTRRLPPSVRDSLLGRYHALLKEDEAIEAMLPEPVREGYFRTVGFQVRFLALAGIIHLESKDREYARSVLGSLHERWDRLEGGVWSGFWCDTIDDRRRNGWDSFMQWAWNEPPKKAFPATAYRPDIPEPVWLEPTGEVPNGGGRWTRIHGLGTSGRAFALLPVKPGVGKGAHLDFELPPGCAGRAVIQFLPDFALWPGLGLGVEVCFDGCPPRYVSVPKSDCRLGETDGVRCAAVQDNFIRVEVEIPAGASRLVVRAVDPGVVIDRVGVYDKSLSSKRHGK